MGNRRARRPIDENPGAGRREEDGDPFAPPSSKAKMSYNLKEERPGDGIKVVRFLVVEQTHPGSSPRVWHVRLYIIFQWYVAVEYNAPQRKSVTQSLKSAHKGTVCSGHGCVCCETLRLYCVQ